MDPLLSTGLFLAASETDCVSCKYCTTKEVAMRVVLRPVFALVILVVAATTTSVWAQDVPPADQMVRLELVAEDLTAPVYITSSPDDSGRLFIIDQIGAIYIVTAEGEMLEEPFLDVRDRMLPLRESFDERGLLGLAFHPAFAQNGRFFVYYSAPLRDEAPEEWDHTSHVSEFLVSENDPDIADPASERVVLQVDQPQFNHNGGTVAFGPDGYLYISLGDGGGSNDIGTGHPPLGNGQDITTILGSILRIDVDGDQPYAIPAGNPFVGTEGVDEIFAYGLRNPYRISFDSGGDNALFAADAGQDLWEEVNIITPGGNYGWNIKEGTSCFDPDNPREPLEECPDTGARGEPLIDPVIEYPHIRQEGGLGVVIVGGHVYRGAAMPALQGGYVFGDWSTSFGQPDGRLFVSFPPANNDGLWPIEELQVEDTADNRPGGYLLGIGTGYDGELYIGLSQRSAPLDQTGQVFRLAPTEPTALTTGAIGSTAPGAPLYVVVGITLLAGSALGLILWRRRRPA
jgi:glucose/arabinose dehydrogenase